MNWVGRSFPNISRNGAFPHRFLKIGTDLLDSNSKKRKVRQVSHDASRRGLFRALARSNSTSTGGWWQRGMDHRQPGRCSGGNRAGLVVFITSTLAGARTTTARVSLYS